MASTSICFSQHTWKTTGQELLVMGNVPKKKYHHLHNGVACHTSLDWLAKHQGVMMACLKQTLEQGSAWTSENLLSLVINASFSAVLLSMLRYVYCTDFSNQSNKEGLLTGMGQRLPRVGHCNICQCGWSTGGGPCGVQYSCDTRGRGQGFWTGWQLTPG